MDAAPVRIERIELSLTKLWDFLTLIHLYLFFRRKKGGGEGGLGGLLEDGNLCGRHFYVTK